MRQGADEMIYRMTLTQGAMAALKAEINPDSPGVIDGEYGEYAACESTGLMELRYNEKVIWKRPEELPPSLTDLQLKLQDVIDGLEAIREGR